MNNSNSASVKDYENKIAYLEDKISRLLNTLKSITAGEVDKAKKSISLYHKNGESQILNHLLKLTSYNSVLIRMDEDKAFGFLKIILEGMPFPVFIKDETGKYLLVNSHEAALFGKDESEIVGKKDDDFVRDDKEMEIIKNSDQEVLRFKKAIELPNQNFTIGDRYYILKTHKVPFINPVTGNLNILGFSIDVTDEANLRTLLFNPYS